MDDVSTIDCLSICEFKPRWQTPAELDALFRRLWNYSGSSQNCERLYFGSVFCPQLFLSLSMEQACILFGYARSSNIALTLELPISSQRALERVKEHAESLLAAAGSAIDEVSVNDYGMFDYWGARIDQGLQIALNIGRLLGKDARDPRDIHSVGPYVPSLLEKNWNGTSNLDRLCATWPVRGLELDPIRGSFDVSALPADVEVSITGSDCYLSTGQICEFAGIHAGDEDKFWPNSPCSFQCQKTAVYYNGASAVEFAKFGRSIFYRSSWPQVKGVSHFRRVYHPLREVLG